MTIAYLSLNLLLLLPIREPVIIVTITSLLLFLFTKTRLKQTLSLVKHNCKTLEGKFACATLLAPIAVYLLRSLLIYDVSNIVVLFMLVVAYIGIRTVSSKTQPTLKFLLESALLVIAVNATWVFWEIIYPSTSLHTPLAASLMSLLFIDVSRVTDNNSMKSFTRICAAASLTVIIAFNHILDATLVTFAFSMLASGMTIAAGYFIRSKAILLIGAVTMAAVLGTDYEYLISMITEASWLSLAIFGSSIIVLASLIERYGAIWKLKLAQSVNT